MLHVEVRRGLAGSARRIDRAIGRAFGRRRVLFDLRNAMNVAVLQPMFSALQHDPRVHVAFASETPARVAADVRRLAGAEVLDHDDVRWQRWDLYVSADPWTRPRLSRYSRSANFFHGVAGNSNLDDPSALEAGFDWFDRVGFINVERMETYLTRGIVSDGAAVLVGFPKADRLVLGGFDAADVKRSLGLDARRPTALYAPGWSPAGSLHAAGEHIVSRLRDAGFNVIIKLHSMSFHPAAKYSGGIDWRSRMDGLQEPGRVAHVTEPDSSPLMAASDVLVTDHSTVGFEYCLLDRPIVLFDAPDLARIARVNPEQVRRLREVGRVVGADEDVGIVARAELAQPDHLSAARRRLAARMFHDPGTATARALTLLYDLLEA
ncbi:MAG TPA: CDP-glycerol glycerophosphotransferase family protein [Vicinamibacterales bacterium]|nr:CDP-glycerol glycerophosphotransferase family protein [Vicinamibacterales bacterium]